MSKIQILNGKQEPYNFLAQIPNMLTIIRIVIAFSFPAISTANRLPFLFAAMITEFLDGTFARKFHWQTDLGQILDPIADKLLFLMVAGTYLLERRLTWLELLVIGSRELIVLIGMGWLIIHGQQKRFSLLKPKISGKLTTALQYIIFFILVANLKPGPSIIYATFFMGIVASVQYISRFFQEDSNPTSRKGNKDLAA